MPSDVSAATQAQLRLDLVTVARSMNASGINQGTSGNLSVRWGDGLLITPSSLPYEHMQPEDVVLLQPGGRWQGRRRPSSEWRLHADVLAHRPDVQAVVHCHSVHATALACHGLAIPSFHYMVVMAGGASIRCAPYATFGTQALSDLALAALEDRRACLLAQHGQVALGTSLDQALRLAIEVETLARMYLQARLIGDPPVLDDCEMERVAAAMAEIHYGETPDPLP
jgi:L-fuculose-phosphate aldolase